MVDTTTPRLPLADPPWADDSFVRRVRALVRTAPLHDLEAGKGQREGDWTPYDLRGLALAAIDTVIDHMGLEFGATGQQVRRRLTDPARMSAPDGTVARILAGADTDVVDAATRLLDGPEGVDLHVERGEADGDASAAAHHGIVAATHLWRRGDVIEPLPGGR